MLKLQYLYDFLKVSNLDICPSMSVLFMDEASSSFSPSSGRTVVDTLKPADTNAPNQT